jgi:hypothetical protein
MYAKAGWAGMGNRLGTGRVDNRLRQFRPFQKARAFVHRLGLKSSAEWYVYRKSDKKPADIPTNPNIVYAQDGWSGMRDWLGTRMPSRRLATFQEGPRVQRRLELNPPGAFRHQSSERSCKSGRRSAC